MEKGKGAQEKKGGKTGVGWREEQKRVGRKRIILYCLLVLLRRWRFRFGHDVFNCEDALHCTV